MEIATLAAALGAHGLILRGGFRPRADDGVPPLADGRGGIFQDYRSRVAEVFRDYDMAAGRPPT